ncbi:hypothetical protein NQ318_013895, partial [Aromia moschata]
MSYLTESLKIEILMMIGYGDRARTQCEVVRLFREMHPDLPPLNQGTINPDIIQSTVSKIESKFRETGDVKDLPKSGRPKITKDKKIDIVLSMEENPQ